MEQQLVAWFVMWLVLELSKKTKISKTVLIWIFVLSWALAYQLLLMYQPELLKQLTFISSNTIMNAWLIYITLNKTKWLLIAEDKKKK
jgi:hypothetical protein